MKKIVPFKKDLIFKTDVEEIVSISLEHTLAKKDTSQIGGDFLINGDYRITETSTSLESFSYTLPFEINLDSKYDLDNVTIDIDDFYYEIINNKVLSVSIEVLLDKLEEKEEILEDKKEELEGEIIEVREEKIEEDRFEEVKKVEKEQIEEESKVEKERCIDLEDTEIMASVSEGTEVYKSYKVYIVREGDTIESILDKYGVTKSELEDYNDLATFNINDKIVIPTTNETNS